MLVEYARNVLGVEGAEHAETSPRAERLVVTPLSCSLVGQDHAVRLLPDTRAAAVYGTGETVEPYYCNYGLNPEYRPRLEDAGLRVSGVDEEGEVRVVELPDHPFFVATLYCFQMRSRPGSPHPLVSGLAAAAANLSRAS